MLIYGGAGIHWCFVHFLSFPPLILDVLEAYYVSETFRDSKYTKMNRI